MTGWLLGVDGGGTKTVAALADRSGAIVAACRTGGSNYQSIGTSAAGRELRAAVNQVLSQAGVTLEAIDAAAFGLAGADREAEMAIVQTMVAEHVPVARRYVENDALLALRAGTEDGVGVGLVAGTGTNCIARDRYGRRLQVGGMGPISGDVGYAEDLAMRALGGAWMAHDGRAGPSALSQAVCEALSVPSVDHLPSRLVRGELPTATVRDAVACLFACARDGDGLAQRIVSDTGHRMGAAAAAALRGLVLKGENAVLVLGGAMLQTAGHERLVEACAARARQAVSEVRVRVLDTDPVVGALLFAHDLLGPVPPAVAERLRADGRALDPRAVG